MAYYAKPGQATAKAVRATSITHDTDLVDVTLRVAAPMHAVPAGKPGAGRARDEVVHTTALHPWLTADHGWLPASFMRLGEPIVRADGTTATVVAIRAVPGAAAMWDLTVGDLHDFAVGAGGYVVHNCAPGVSDIHPTDPNAFEITDWTGYPEGAVPRPRGLFRLLEGDEYDAARAAGDRGARAYGRAVGKPAWWESHHIQPVKFGGSPTAPGNFMPLPRITHQFYSAFWDGLQSEIESGNFGRIRFLR